MPVSRLASERDIQDTDILTATATLIRTGTTDRTTMVGRHFIGITGAECTTRVRIIVTTATGDKISGEEFSQAGGFKIPPAYFFGEVDAAGADVDGPDGDGSWNSFFKRSRSAGNCSWRFASVSCRSSCSIRRLS
jgi:hypothetical protein